MCDDDYSAAATGRKQNFSPTLEIFGGNGLPAVFEPQAAKARDAKADSVIDYAKHTPKRTDHRIEFYGDGGRSGSTFGNVFCYFGPDRSAFVERFSEFGAIVARAAA